MATTRIPSVEGGIQPTIVTTKGDIIVATGNASLVRQGVGANGTVLTANSAQADGVEWLAPDPLTTKGDLFTYSTIETRLAVGANDTVLTADSTAATGLKWATPAAGGMTLISTTALSGTSTTVSSIPGTYKGLVAIIDKVTFNTSAEFTVGLTSATNIYNSIIGNAVLSSQTAQSKVRSYASTIWPTGVVFQLYNYTSTAGSHTGQLYYGDSYNGSVSSTFFSTFSSTAVTSLIFSSQAGTSTFSSGTVKLYGVN